MTLPQILLNNPTLHQVLHISFNDLDVYTIPTHHVSTGIDLSSIRKESNYIPRPNHVSGTYNVIPGLNVEENVTSFMGYILAIEGLPQWCLEILGLDDELRLLLECFEDASEVVNRKDGLAVQRRKDRKKMTWKRKRQRMGDQIKEDIEVHESGMRDVDEVEEMADGCTQEQNHNVVLEHRRMQQGATEYVMDTMTEEVEKLTTGPNNETLRKDHTIEPTIATEPESLQLFEDTYGRGRDIMSLLEDHLERVEVRIA